MTVFPMPSDAVMSTLFVDPAVNGVPEERMVEVPVDATLLTEVTGTVLPFNFSWTLLGFRTLWPLSITVMANPVGIPTTLLITILSAGTVTSLMLST